MRALRLTFVTLTLLSLAVGTTPSALRAETEPDATSAIEVEPAETPPADLAPARALVREANYEQAEALLAELQTAHPDDPALLLLRGEVLNAAGRPDQAIPVLRRAAAISPERERVHFQLATALSATGDTEGALAAFARETEVSQDPEVQLLARLNRSILLGAAEKWDEAAGELERVLELRPDRKEAYSDLAQIYLEAGRVDDAENTLERGETAGFHSGRLRYRVGVARYNDREYESAARAFRKSLELQPELAQAERSLAMALERLGRHDEAAAHLRRYLELRPDASDAEQIRKQLGASSKKG